MSDIMYILKKSAQSAITLLYTFIVCFLESRYSYADRIPGTAFMGPNVYYTDAMDPIQVLFWGKIENREKTPPDSIATLPRAYIFAAPGYSKEEYNELPRRLEVDKLYVMFSYPDGVPYKESYSKKKNLVEFQGNTIREYVITHYIAIMHQTVNSIEQLWFLLPEEYRPESEIRTNERYIYNFDGFKGYESGGSFYYYGNIDSDVRKIKCLRAPELAHPGSFCTYTTIINERMYVEVDFVDFRLHGGAEFAEERIRVFKEILCRHVSCANPSTRYNWEQLRWR